MYPELAPDTTSSAPRYTQLDVNNPASLYAAINASVRNASNLSRRDLQLETLRLATDFETLRRHYVGNSASFISSDIHDYTKALGQIAWLESYLDSGFSRINTFFLQAYLAFSLVIPALLVGATFANLAIPPTSDFIGDGSFDCNEETFNWSIKNIKSDLSSSLNGSLGMLGAACALWVGLLGFILYHFNINTMIPLQRQSSDLFATSKTRLVTYAANIMLLIFGIGFSIAAVLSTLAARRLPTMSTAVVESAMTIYKNASLDAYAYEFSDNQAKQLIKSLFYDNAPTITLVVSSITAALLMLAIFRTQIAATLSSIVKPGLLQCIGLMRAPADVAEINPILRPQTGRNISPLRL